MKRFYVKERLFAIGAKFDIYDENDNKIFIAEGDRFDIGKNRKLLYMRQQIRLGTHKYIAYDENMKEIATIKKEFMIPEYNITGTVGIMNMDSSSILGRNYEIKRNGIIIGKINKELTLGRDRYFLEVMVKFHKNN